jgi:6-pyruvoyltetrahydropterin/6-carboxytetrahydropterin synthase
MPKYTVGVIRDFIAQHFLFGGDWGRENQLHAHHYKLEAIFEGDELDRHGYLLDIAVVNQHLDAVVGRFRDRTLNDLPELGGQNPGIEVFARALAESLVARLDTRGLSGLTIKLWEHEQAYCTYQLNL